MIKALVLGFLIFLILALLTGIWGQLQRIQQIMERGIWQQDQYLKKMCNLIVGNVDVISDLLHAYTHMELGKKGDNENGKL